MSTIPKAVLYYSPESVWSATALLTLEEKGYGQDEVDLKQVDLSKGENFDLTFLRLNPKATVPTLVVPLQKTLSSEVESRYKAITDTKAIVDFLDKSRSPMSRTNTTSTQPAPTLAPATISFSSTSNAIIGEIHPSEDSAPDNLLFMNARDDASLQHLAKIAVPLLTGRLQALDGFLAEAEKNEGVGVSVKTKQFWVQNQLGIQVLLDVFSSAEKASGELSEHEKEAREKYLITARQAWEMVLKASLISVNNQIIAPFALGEQLSVADMHLAAWLARIVKLSGGNASLDGKSAMAKIETRIGHGFVIPKNFEPSDVQRSKDAAVGVTNAVKESRLAVFWDVMRERASWRKIYGEGLG